MFIFSIIKEILLKWLVVGGKFITITKKKKKKNWRAQSIMHILIGNRGQP
jgi:hypothetical protein